MGNQQNKDSSNRAKNRRARREASRVPGKGAGPIPIRAPQGQPAVNSLADLAKAGGGNIPLSVPQLMAKVGTLTVERDFWMSAALNLEQQVNALTGGATVPTPEDVATAETEAAQEEGDIQDISVEKTECPVCQVTLGPEAVHDESCQLQEIEFPNEEEEEGEPEQIGANVPSETPVILNKLTEEEQAVVDEANRIVTLQGEAQAAETAQLEEEPPE